MHYCNVAGDVGEVECFFQRRVAAADHRDFLAFVEKTIAGGASRHAFAHEFFFGGQAEIHCRGAGGDNQRVAGVGGVITDQRDRCLFKFGGVDLIEYDLGFKALGVLQKAFHQLRALHAVDVGRPVIDFGGGHQLAALGHAGNQHRVQVGASSVDGGGVAGGTGAENQQAAVARSFSHDFNLVSGKARM